MKTFLLPFLGSIFLSVNLCSAQTNSWSNGSEWTLYDVKGAKFYKLKVDTLSQLPHRKLDDVTMQSFLDGAAALSPNRIPAWMGAYVVSYTDQHVTHKVDISTYSGFFYDESTKAFFQISADKQKSWHDYLAQNMNALLTSQ